MNKQELKIDHCGYEPTPRENSMTSYCPEWKQGKRNATMCDYCKQPLEKDGQIRKWVKGKLVKACSQYCFAKLMKDRKRCV